MVGLNRLSGLVEGKLFKVIKKEEEERKRRARYWSSTIDVLVIQGIQRNSIREYENFLCN